MWSVFFPLLRGEMTTEQKVEGTTINLCCRLFDPLTPKNELDKNDKLRGRKLAGRKDDIISLQDCEMNLSSFRQNCAVCSFCHPVVFSLMRNKKNPQIAVISPFSSVAFSLQYNEKTTWHKQATRHSTRYIDLARKPETLEKELEINICGIVVRLIRENEHPRNGVNGQGKMVYNDVACKMINMVPPREGIKA